MDLTWREKRGILSTLLLNNEYTATIYSHYFGTVFGFDKTNVYFAYR